MPTPTTAIRLSNSTPAPPTNQQDIVFQSDDGIPQQTISAYDPVMMGDTGSGGTAGNVPAPASGAAAAGKFLKADGTWEVPPGTAAPGMANPMTTVGDLIIGGTVTGGTAAPTRLGAGSSGDVLTSNGAGLAPSWQAPSGGGGGGTSVQFGAGSPTGATMVQALTALGTSITYPSNVTSGNLLLVVINNSVSALTVADTVGTTYSQLYIDNEAPTGIDFQVWAGIAPSTGANTVSFTASGDSFQSMGIMEVSGATATVDVQASFDTGSSNPSSQTPTVSVTTTVANDFLFLAVGGSHDGNVFSLASPFTLDSQVNGNDAQAVAHASVGAAGAYTATVTMSGGTGTAYNQLVLIAFKPLSLGITGAEGDIYFDTSTTPFTGYVYHSSTWYEF